MADPCVQLAQRLAANDKKSRDRALRRLRTYLRERSGHPDGLSLEDLCKVWKGLFYCLWMQDKPLLQEELSLSMARLLQVLQSPDSRDAFLRAFWQTLSREWNGIDRLRLDKFYSLIRFVLHQSAQLLKQADWEQSAVEEFLGLLLEEVLKPEAPHGVQHHLIDIYLEELAKVGSEELSAEMNLRLIGPFCEIAAKTKDPILQQSVVDGIFQIILDQAPYAIEDLMKELGHTPDHGDGNPQAAALLDAEDVGPVLQFDYQAISDRLFTLASCQDVPARNRNCLYRLVKRFKNLANGVFSWDGYPEEVSTDEDDDEFSSWRFRKRQKKFQRRLLESQGIAPEPKTRERSPAEPPAKKKARKKRKNKRSRPTPKKTLQSQHNGTVETPPTTDQSQATPLEVAAKLRRRRSNLIRLGLSVLPLRRALLFRRRRAISRRRQLLSNQPAPQATPPTPPMTPPPAKATPARQDFITFKKSEAPRALYVKSSNSRGRQIITKQNGKSKKVTFSLNKNMMTEFKRTDRSLLVSPSGSSRVPFNPAQRPQQGVLKTPSPVGRARASDFF